MPPTTPEPNETIAYFRVSALETARSLRDMLEPRGVLPNIGAGITVALVALPLNLALALACGLPPEVGLVTGAVAGILGALLGASKFQITGPEVALAPITLELVTRYGVEGMVATAFLAGLIQIALGVLRVGRIIHSIPVPVVGGFLAAVGLLVFDSQVPRLLGLPADVRLLSELRTLNVLADYQPTTIVVGAAVVAGIVLLPKLSRRVPAQLVAVGATVAAVAWFGLRVPTVPPVSGSWPGFQVPSLSIDWIELMPGALALALLASIDSLLCAVSIGSRTSEPTIRTDQELVAQGLANVGSACFGGMPVAAAVVRSVAAVEAGATTRLAPLAQSVVLGAVLIVLAPYVSLVPIAALAGVLLVIGYRLIDVRQLAQLWRVARAEALVFCATTFGILVTDFVSGVGIGVVASLAYFAYQQRMAMLPRIIPLDDASRDSGGLDASRYAPRIMHLEGPLFFGSQDRIDEVIEQMSHTARVKLDLSAVTTVDISGATALTNALGQLQQRGVDVAVIAQEANTALRWFLEHCEQLGIRVERTRARANGSAQLIEARAPMLSRRIARDRSDHLQPQEIAYEPSN